MVAIRNRRVAPVGPGVADQHSSGHLRVLHVVSHFPPDRVGGVGEVAAHLHRALLDRGHDSRVLTTGHTTGDPTVTRICAGPGAGFTRRSGSFVDDAGEFDLVHVHHGEALPLLVGLRRRDARTLMTLHVDNRSIVRAAMPRRVDGERIGSWSTAVRDGLVLGTAKVALDVIARRLVDRSSFISHFGAREIAGSSGGPVIHNGVVVPSAPDRSTSGTSLLYVGTAGPRKRTALLPGLMARVRRREPDARMTVIGFDAADEPDLVASVRRRGLEDAFDFVGPVRNDELGPHYGAAAALVVPSCYEGLPMVALEAMSHGLPIVATRAGGIEEAVTDGVHGRIVDVDDVDALADAAVQLLGDRTLAETMGEAGRDRIVQEFDVDDQIDRYLDLYRAMVTR